MMPILNRRAGSLIALVLFVVAIVALSGSHVQAAPSLAMKVQWGTGSEWNSSATDFQYSQDGSNPDVYNFSGGHTASAWASTWSGNVDLDPAINSAIAVTNNSGVNQTFIVTLSLPVIGGVVAPSTILGGVTVSITAPGFAGTVSTPAGDFMYRAATGSGGFVGAPADLLPPPFSLNTPLGLPASAGPFNFGPNNGPGLLVVDSIAIRNAFVLTPGASATLNSTFIIQGENVPEPATMIALVPLAGMMIARRRRV